MGMMKPEATRCQPATNVRLRASERHILRFIKRNIAVALIFLHKAGCVGGNLAPGTGSQLLFVWIIA